MNLFDNSLSSVSILKITREDVYRNTDTIRVFSYLIAKNEPMYPDISRWLKSKVFPGIRDDSRAAFIALYDDKPIATAVVKRESRAKFCHLRIHENFQDNSLGDFFFVLMAFEVRNWAKEIHFTLPESLWESEKNFFNSFGFKNTAISSIQYRLFDKELFCSAPFEEVWSHILEKIPKLIRLFSVNKFSPFPQLLLSIKPDFANKIFSGEKTVELRTRFSRRWAGHRIAIYAGGKIKRLLGEATIRKVEVGEPSFIWLNYNSDIGCSYKDFQEYVGNRKELYAIELSNINPYVSPIPVSQIEHLSHQTLKPPQSYLELNENSPWTKAISIANLLHANNYSMKQSDTTNQAPKHISHFSKVEQLSIF